MVGFALLPLGLLNACSTVSLLLGTEKPVDEKSKSYQVKDLSQGSTEWSKVDPSNIEKYDKKSDSPDSLSTSVSDVTYISRKDASVISLNSSCDSSPNKADLRSSSDELFYGMRDVNYRQELGIAVQNTPALQITARGNIYGDPMMIRTVVFRRNSCFFDFIYLSAPENFKKSENTFSSFIASFKFNANS